MSHCRSNSLFQSTLPHGSDCRMQLSMLLYHQISIHAPSRERPLTPAMRLLPAQFQSTLPHGSDRPEFLGSHSSMIFQSTLPHGSDLISIGRPLLIWEFQSTLPHGSDFKIFETWNSVIAFQSTLPHGSDMLHFINRI